MSFGGLRGFHVLTLPLYMHIYNENIDPTKNGMQGIYASAVDNLIYHHPGLKETRRCLQQFEDHMYQLIGNQHILKSRQRFVREAKNDPIILDFISKHVFTLGLCDSQGMEYESKASEISKDITKRFRNITHALDRGNVPPHKMCLRPRLAIDHLTSKDAFLEGVDENKKDDALVQLWLRDQFPRLSSSLTDCIIKDTADDISQIGSDYPSDWHSMIVHALYKSDSHFLDEDLYTILPPEPASRLLKITIIIPLSSSPHVCDILDNQNNSNESTVSTGNERDDAIWSIAQHLHHRETSSSRGKTIINMPRFYIAQIAENMLNKPGEIIRGATRVSEPTIRSITHKNLYSIHGKGYLSDFTGVDVKQQYIFASEGDDTDIITKHTDGTKTPYNIIRGFSSRVSFESWRLNEQLVKRFDEIKNDPNDVDRTLLSGAISSIAHSAHVPIAHLCYTRLPMSLYDDTVLFRRVNNVHPNTMHLTDGSSVVAKGGFGGAVRVAWSFGHSSSSSANDAKGKDGCLKTVSNIKNNPVPNARNFATIFEIKRYIKLVRENADVHQKYRYKTVGRHFIDEHNVLQTVNLWFTTVDDNTPLICVCSAESTISKKNTIPTPKPYDVHLNLPIPLDLELDWASVRDDSDKDLMYIRLNEVTNAYTITCNLLQQLCNLFEEYNTGPREGRHELTQRALQIYVTTYLNPMHRMLYPSKNYPDSTSGLVNSLTRKYPNTWSIVQFRLLNQLANPYSQFEKKFHVDMSIQVRTRNIVKVMETRVSNAMGEYSYMHYLSMSLRYDPVSHAVRSIYDMIPEQLASLNNDIVSITRDQANQHMTDAYLPSVYPPDLSMKIEGLVYQDVSSDIEGRPLWSQNDRLRVVFRDENGSVPIVIDRLQKASVQRNVSEIISSTLDIDHSRYKYHPWKNFSGDFSSRGGLKIIKKGLNLSIQIPRPTIHAFCPAYQAFVQMNPNGSDSILMPHMTHLDLARVIDAMGRSHRSQIEYAYNQRKNPSFNSNMSLRTLVERGDVVAPPISINQLLVGIADTFGAIHTMNQLGLAHLDLKPENVLVDGNGQCYITDLGFVTPYGRQGMLGTPSVITPEMNRVYPGFVRDGTKFNQIVPFDSQADSMMMATGLLRDLFNLSAREFDTFIAENDVIMSTMGIGPNDKHKFEYDYEAVMSNMTSTRVNREKSMFLMRNPNRAMVGMLGTTANMKVLDYISKISSIRVEDIIGYVYVVPDDEYIRPSQLPCTPMMSIHICNQVFTILAELCFDPQLNGDQINKDYFDRTSSMGPGSLVRGFITDIRRKLGGYNREWYNMSFQDQQSYGFMNKLKAAEIKLRLLISQVIADQENIANCCVVKQRV